MRSGTYKETFDDLVALTDQPLVWVWSGVLCAALIALPFVVNSYLLSLLILVLITLVGAVGLNVLTGLAGVLSLGHAGFLMLGAYGYAVVVSRYQLSPILGFVAAGFVPALFAVVVGIPSLRLRGLYLAITTLAFSEIISGVILEARSLTAGARGIAVRRPVLAGLDLGDDRTFALFCLCAAVLTVLASLNIRRSRVGRAFIAIRDNDTAAQMMGINLQRYKLYAFTTSAFITGIAGGLMAIYLSFVNVEGFPFLFSIEALAILIVGGMGSTLGVVFGTVFIVLLPEVVRAAVDLIGQGFATSFSGGVHEVKALIYGVVIILFLRFEPRGLLGLWHDIRRTWSHWPLKY